MKKIKITRKDLYLIKESVELFISYFRYNFFVNEYLKLPDVLEKKKELLRINEEICNALENSDCRTKHFEIEILQDFLSNVDIIQNE